MTEAAWRRPTGGTNRSPAAEAEGDREPGGPPGRSGLLFDLGGEGGRAPSPAADWISAPRPAGLRGIKALAGRAVPADDLFLRLLAAVENRGGKITSAALARAIEYPPLRLRGLLAVSQRVLNIDGYAVLTRDEASDTVELNRQLLCRQFGLPE